MNQIPFSTEISNAMTEEEAITKDEIAACIYQERVEEPSVESQDDCGPPLGNRKRSETHGVQVRQLSP
jgi:hypothetical protein